MASNPHLNAQNGVTGAYTGDNEHIVRSMMAFAAIAWYNSFELIVLCLVVFKRYQGLYFWSMLITSIAIIPYTIGAWGRLVGIYHSNLPGMIVSNLGWLAMVNGESVVLYSRLHLVTDDRRILKGLLVIIITNLFILYIPTSVLAFGSQLPGQTTFVAGYAIMEKIQMTIWSVQEIIISGVYLWEVRRILRVMYEQGTRKLLYELVAINVAIILLDIALLTVEFLNLYQIEVTLKGMVYSVKLKMEFAVLSKLVKVVTHTDDNGMQRVTTVETTETEKAILPNSPVASPTSPSSRFGRMSSWPWPQKSSGGLGNDAEWIEESMSSGMNRSLSSSEWRNESVDFEPTRQIVQKKASDEDMYPGRLC